MNNITIRPYTPTDYSSVKKLYKDSGWFDPETDAAERLKQKIERDPESILVATSSQIVGTLSLIEDGRIALFFRLITIDGDLAGEIRKRLLTEGQTVFQKRGYNEAHIIVPENDKERQEAYEANGFVKGEQYRWMWKKIE